MGAWFWGFMWGVLVGAWAGRLIDSWPRKPDIRQRFQDAMDAEYRVVMDDIDNQLKRKAGRQ